MKLVLLERAQKEESNGTLLDATALFSYIRVHKKVNPMMSYFHNESHDTLFVVFLLNLIRLDGKS